MDMSSQPIKETVWPGSSGLLVLPGAGICGRMLWSGGSWKNEQYGLSKR